MKSSKNLLGMVYHIGPGQMPLNKSATLEISYSDFVDKHINSLHLSIYRESSEGNWEKISSKVDKDKKLVIGEIDQLGSFKLIYDPSSQSEEILPVPKVYSLSQNYPNPFNPNTTIHFTLPESEFVTLKVFDLLGREVKTLIEEQQKAGDYRITFDASGLASGVYIYRLKAGNSLENSGNSFIASKKMVLIR